MEAIVNNLTKTSGIESRIKQQARLLGFELVGIAHADEAETSETFEAWRTAGHAGEMNYMHRHAAARRHPESILPDVRSIVMVGLNYKPAEDSSPPPPASGKIARYALSRDYHDVLREKLAALLAWIHEQAPDAHGRAVVDTAPLLERDFARRGGLGWFGKNTMLLNKNLGSYFYIGALLLDIDLEADAPFETSHCGTCTACLDACPTSAFVEPGVLDSRRCISYLTIELRGPIPEEFRTDMADWVFGCDVCQEVCPWNRKAPVRHSVERPASSSVDLFQLLRLSESQFRERFQGTPLMRPKRGGLLRNAAIALGNQGDRAAIPALQQATHDPDPLVRDAAAWAIRRIEQLHAVEGVNHEAI